MVRSRKAYTTAELIIYAVLALLLMTLVYAAFRIGRRGYEASSSSYLVGNEASSAIRWLKVDLQETALSSIQVGLFGADKYPGISMIGSGEKDNRRRSFTVSPYGTPNWTRHVFYILDRDGKLTRWEKDLEEPTSAKRFLPVPATIPPTPVAGDRQRTILHNLLIPNQELKPAGQDSTFPKMDDWGGFKAGFIVRDSSGKEELISRNPSEVSAALADGQTSLDGVDLDLNEFTTTRMVEVRLGIVLEGARRDNPSAIALPIRVTPLH